MVVPNGTVRNFETPTQVAWFDGEHEDWKGGIGVDDYIICGCCGGTVPLDEVYEMTDFYNADHPETPIKNPIVFLEWVDIDEEIRGDLNL